MQVSQNYIDRVTHIIAQSADEDTFKARQCKRDMIRCGSNLLSHWQCQSQLTHAARLPLVRSCHLRQCNFHGDHLRNAHNRVLTAASAAVRSGCWSAPPRGAGCS